MSEQVTSTEAAQDNTAAGSEQVTTEQNTSTTETAKTESSSILSGDPEAKGTEPQAKTEPEKTEKTETEKVVPEKYEAFKVPEGMKIDQGEDSSFVKAAKEAQLSQEQAQKFIDLGIKNIQDHTQTMRDAHDAQVKQWTQDIKSDPEFGGDNFNETVTRANRVLANETLAKVGMKDVLADLQMTGRANHPAYIKMFAAIDKMIGDDKLVDGKPGASGEKSAAQTLYGTK